MTATGKGDKANGRKGSLHNYTLCYSARSGFLDCLKYAFCIIKATDVYNYTLSSSAGSVLLNVSYMLVKLYYAEKGIIYFKLFMIHWDMSSQANLL